MGGYGGGILVFFMQAGFALVESGSVRSKNTINVLMKNYMDACLGGLVFWLVGFGLMFGLGGLGSAFFGWLADKASIEFIFKVSAYLPLLGIIAGFLPNTQDTKHKA